MRTAVVGGLTGAVLAFGGGRARAQDGASLLGLAPGSPPAALAALGRRAGADCHAVAPAPGTAAASLPFVCASPPFPFPVPASVTYWYNDGALDRAFAVDNLVSERAGDYQAHFALIEAWVMRALGPPARRQPPPAHWGGVRPLPDVGQMAELRGGAVRVAATWEMPGAVVDLWLTGEGGQPRLVLGARAAGIVPPPAAAAAAAATSKPVETNCAPQAIAEAMFDLFPPANEATRAQAARTLAACHTTRAAGALETALEHDAAGSVKAESLRALDRLGQLKDDEKLERLARGEGDAAKMAHEIVRERDEARRQKAEAVAEAGVKEAIRTAVVPGAGAPSTSTTRTTTTTTSTSTSTSTSTTGMAMANVTAPVAVPRGPISGTPLAIGASTIAGAALMRNLGLMGGEGLEGVTPQLLLGTSGAIIGFGTSWGLSRFGFRPTLAQAAWFANTTAWGTLAGGMAWGASGSSSPKIQYGALALGQATGMGLGVWSARRWKWTLGQTAVADSLVLGAGLSSLGVGLMRDPSPGIKPVHAIAAPPVMVLAAIAAHNMNPTENDLRLMGFGALSGAWSGALLAGGAYETGFLSSRQSAGGAVAGLGAGYLLSAAAGAVSETEGWRLGAAAGGMVAGNALGLGLHLLAQGFAHDDVAGASFTAEERNRRALSAGAGGVALGAAAWVVAPRLHLGPQAPWLATAGAVYGGAIPALAWRAAHSGPTSDVASAQLVGGLLAGGVLGGISGLASSRFIAPDENDHLTAAAATGLGMAGGLGVARLATTEQGAPDATGVMVGAAAGLAAGAWTAHATRLRAPDVGAGMAGLAYGALAGALLPTLGDDVWGSGRSTEGGALLGLAAGGAGSAAAAHLTGADGAHVGLPVAAAVFGGGIGLGVGMVWPCADDGACTSQAPRAGALIGPLALAGGALALDPWLHLSDGPGPTAGRLAFSGAVFGGMWGMLAAGAVDPSGLVGDSPDRRLQGGLLAGGSAGIASGLVLSRFYAPTPEDIGFTFASSLAGTALGLGITELAWSDAGRHDTVGMLAGSSAAMLAGAALAPRLDLRGPDLGAATLGLGAGALVGTLLPSLGSDEWAGERRGGGGALVGLALGAGGGAAASVLTQASAGQVGITALGTALGTSAGAGAGLMLSSNTSQSTRIGTVAGVAGGAALGLLGNATLHLDDGLGPNAGTLAWLGGVFGVADGLMVAGALDDSGLISGTPDRHLWGGVVMASSVEIGAGLALSRQVRLQQGDGWVLAGGKLLGGMFGRGVALASSDEPGRADTLGTLAGSVAGLGAAAAAQATGRVTGTDLAASAVGLGFGGVLGALAPTLDEESWRGIDGRLSEGSLLIGLSGGVMGAAALRHATGAAPATVGLTALGGADGLVTGLGVGLLVDGESGGSDRAERIGIVAGTAAGLGVGALLWPRLELGADGALFTSAAGLVGGWTGVWLPSLGHADSGDVPGLRTAGGLLAGAGGASLAASLLAPVLRPDPDLVMNAVAVDALWTGAGAGAGALLSTRDDAPVWGMLGAGTAGLLAGGALHRSIEIDGRDAPLLALAGAEGAWLGGWLPNLVFDREITDRERAGGLAAGTLGGLGLATVASGALEIDGARAGYAALGSGLGASIGGGIALLSPSLHDQRGVGIMLGGTAVGLAAGAGFVPRLELASPSATLGAVAAGGALGASEALLFAWSGRAQGGGGYGGAALLGGGVGATLGLAASSAALDLTSNGPAAAGFAAWGAWVGSFSGSLVKNDTHEVVMGGVIGANAGFFGGYALLRTGAVEPRDFGWLSLFGALGTVAGAGAGAPFSSRDNPTPVLIGLAAGPVVGMGVGALVLPKLRQMVAPGAGAAAWRVRERGRAVASAVTATGAQTTASERLVLSPEIVDAPGSPARGGAGLLHRLSKVVEVTEWAPLVGSLPAPEANGPAPLLFGVTGLWR